MKQKKILIFAGIVVAVTLAFLGGRGFERTQSAYRLDVIESKTYPFDHGELNLIHAFESVGLSFMNTGSSIIELSNRTLGKITLYKAHRSFQEISPSVRNIVVESNKLFWDDNWFKYSLTITPLEGEQDE
jgi:hypothetical protein